MVNQNLPHQMSCYRQKLCPAFPSSVLLQRQAKVRFVHQGGGLQRVLCALSPHLTVGQPPELRIYQLDKPALGLLVPFLHCSEQVCDFSGRSRQMFQPFVTPSLTSIQTETRATLFRGTGAVARRTREGLPSCRALTTIHRPGAAANCPPPPHVLVVYSPPSLLVLA